MPTTAQTQDDSVLAREIKQVIVEPVNSIPLNRFERRHPNLSATLKEMPPFVARNHPRFKEWTGYSGRCCKD